MSLLLSQIRCADICSELALLKQGINKVSTGIIMYNSKQLHNINVTLR